MKHLVELTHEIALKESIMLWRWLAKTGELKSEWPGWKKWDYKPVYSCFLCCFRDVATRICFCKECPLWDKGIDMPCCQPGQPFYEWDDADTVDERKYWAKAVLIQLLFAKQDERNTSI